MEKWGAVSIVFLYTIALEGMWLYNGKNNDYLPRPMPEKMPKNRDACCRILAD